MQPLADLRTEYAKASLDITDVFSDPIKQFEKWFNEAVTSQVPEPNAMNLATVNEHGRPASRIVLLKGIEDHRFFVFYTNYQSEKGRELEKNPACALTFFWPELERQVRIEGIADRVAANQSELYFQSRPRSSQIGAWSSPQSSIIESREILEERYREMEKKFDGKDSLPKPHQWGGFKVEPLLVEFWQGRPSRLHDRIRYTKVDGTWKTYRLAP
jgi:pyridoxamine 5'-phosphate oxidase